MRYWQTSDQRYEPIYEYSDPPSNRFTPGIKWLIIFNVAPFIVNIWFSTAFLALSRETAFHKGYIWQFITYAFLHADLWHLLFNMLVLYMFGRDIEMRWGTKRFLIFYLGAAAFSGALFALTDYIFYPNNPSMCVGASGAIYAILMVYALWWPNRVIFFMFLFQMKMRTFVLIITAIETYNLIMLAQGRNYTVAIMAHMGGLLYGFLVVKTLPLLHRAQTLRQERYADGLEADYRRVDQILDKVHREGMQSLSWSEQRFLKKHSQRRR